ncbi:MAG: nitrilase-related carbon-nitrogen hydrolase [Atribacterota bacterium]
MLKIGFYQYSPKFKSVDENLEKVVQKLNNIDADIMVLPELAFTGYNFSDRDELTDVAEVPHNSNIVKELTTLCSRNNFYLVTGFAEKSGFKIFNSSLLIGPDGLLDIYRKIHLFNREKLYFDPGDTNLTVNKIKGAKVGMMVCFDWGFPEVARSLALLGATVICHPSNLVLNYCQNVMLSRCLENRVFAVTANRVGEENRKHDNLRFTGQSQIADPKGNLLFRADADQEILYIHEINPEDALDKNITKYNHIFNDRRPEFYKNLW